MHNNTATKQQMNKDKNKQTEKYNIHQYTLTSLFVNITPQSGGIQQWHLVVFNSRKGTQILKHSE